jgi:glycosyltransferase involved in cell wall biosynthesis
VRVLHLLYDSPGNPWVGGGGAVRAAEINRRLAARGVEVEQLAGAFPGVEVDQEVVPGYRVRRLGISRPYPLSRLTFSRLAGRVARRGSWDVLVTDFSVYTPVPPPPAGRPAVAIVHHLTGPTAPRRWGGIAGRALARHEAARLRRFRRFSAVSPATAAALRVVAGPAADVRVIENGVDPALFGIERRPADPPFLLYLGRIDTFHKGLDVLVDAFGRLASRRSGVRLRVAGRGRDLEALRTRIASSPAAGSIDVLGAVDEARKRDLLASTSGVVMPSRMEGWGMVAAEAMAAGAPLLVSDAGSLPGLVGGHALVVRAGDAGALLEGMERLLADPAAAGGRAAAARLAARDRFDWDAIAERHLDLLRSAEPATHP